MVLLTLSPDKGVFNVDYGRFSRPDFSFYAFSDATGLK